MDLLLQAQLLRRRQLVLDLTLKHQPGHRQAHCRAHRRRIHGGAEGKERQIHKQRLQGEDQLSYSYGGWRLGTEPGSG